MNTSTIASCRLYIRREPTTDTEVRPSSHKRDWVMYYDREATRVAGRIPWWHRGPRTTARTMMFNCARWALVWLPEAAP